MASPVQGPNADISTVVGVSASEKIFHSDSDRITYLENRVTVLENEILRFQNALIGAGKFIFENPMSKMMLASLPKDAQNRLREFFEERKNNGT